MAVSRINEAGLNVNQYGNRNLVINGAMNVAQRGTSSTSSGVKTIDRFAFNASSYDEAAFTQTQSSVAPSGFVKSYRIDCTTVESTLAADEIANVSQVIEAQDLQHIQNGSSDAKSLTLSFYVKSNKTGTYTVNFYKPDNTARHISSTYNINTADTWEYKTITIAGDTSGGGIANDTGAGLYLYWILSAGSDYTSSDSTSWGNYANAGFAYGQTVNIFDSTSNDWAVTGVQLEVGDTATDFEHRTFADELIKCERYLQKRGTDTSGWEFLADAGQLGSATAYQCAVRFRQKMRAAPSFSYTGNLSDIYLVRAFSTHAISSVSIADNTNGNTLLLTGAVANTSGSAGEQTRMQTLTAGTNFFFDAEL